MNMRITRKRSNGERQAPHLQTPFYNRIYLLTSIVALLALIFFIIPGRQVTRTTGGRVFKKRINDGRQRNCSDFCNAHRSKRKERFSGDLLNRTHLVRLVTKARNELISDKLLVDYGDHFENLFVDRSSATAASSGFDGNETRYRGVQPATLGTGESLKRLKRKLQMKVLSMQLSLKKLESDMNGCDCTNGDKPLSRKNPIKNMAMDNLTDTIKASYARYVWATGGNSVAAGHGNLFNESETAFLERDVKDILGSIGIEFEGRNYGMSGATSGPEIAMCSEQIFGSDVDFLVWDYSLTDANRYNLLFHFGFRGGLNQGRPAFLAWRVQEKEERRTSILKQLEDMGMSVFFGETASVRHAIPDTFGLSIKEIAAMPEYVRNFKCQGKIESGEPFCEEEKFSKFTCPNRNRRTNWHPGFKTFALDGHTMALFLTQTLIDALRDLVKVGVQDPEELLAQLLKEDQQLYQGLGDANLPDDLKIVSYRNGEGEETVIDVSTDLLFKGPSICHTARLPSQIRYRGYLMNNGKTGNIAKFGNETYETGSVIKDLDRESANGVARLGYVDNGMEREVCQVVLAPDYNDFFYSHHRDGWTKLTFPNEAEKTAYRYRESDFQGFIAIFFTLCDVWACADTELRGAEGFEEGKWEMMINGKPVKDLIYFGPGRGDRSSYIPKGDEGFYWPASSTGDYEIAILVKEPDHFVKLSGVVLY